MEPGKLFTSSSSINATPAPTSTLSAEESKLISSSDIFKLFGATVTLPPPMTVEKWMIISQTVEEYLKKKQIVEPITTNQKKVASVGIS